MTDKKTKISEAKGRPMLRWVGKKPLDQIKSFPAQLVEVFNPTGKAKQIENPSFENLQNNWQNLLFHGDNKEVIGYLLANDFRGKIDLVYIDPPFNTGVDYIRKVQLRGINAGRLEGEDYSPQEQIMYLNNFADDTYLQFMYERLILLKELLSDNGNIFIRIDWRFGHYVKLLMDEIFGKENFRNEIVVNKSDRPTETLKKYHSTWDMLLYYSKSDNSYFLNVEIEREEQKWRPMHLQGVRWTEIKKESITLFNRENIKVRNGKFYSRARIILGKETLPPEDRHWALNQEAIFKLEKEGKIKLNGNNNPVSLESPNKKVNDVWIDIPGYSPQNTGYPTENAEEFLKRVILTGCRVNEIVLDCFMGSGTTQAVAQKLGRRWIGCDINKGAIQTTSKRLQRIILEHHKDKKLNGTQQKMNGDKEAAKYNVFAHYKVNDYDLQLLRTEAIELAIQHIGIQRTKTDSFFEGTLGKNLVKIIDFNHPLTLLDLQLVQDELKQRPDENRNITVVCLGKELAVDSWIEDYNKKHPINKLEVIELRTDKKYGKFLIYKPAEASVNTKRKDDKAFVEIENFISPSIIERLNDEEKLVKVKIPDFRSMIDVVLIDNKYDGKVFNIVYSDVPEKKNYLVQGKYEIEIPKVKTKIAVKIIDMLGEEVLVTKDV